MLPIWLKHAIKRAFENVGLDIRKRFSLQTESSVMPSAPRASLAGCLRCAQKNGVQPRTIIDIGAANGTLELCEAFPEARHILIEPLKEFASDLEMLVSRMNHAEYIQAAVTSSQETVVINVHPDLFGSSIYQEEEDSDVNGVERTVPAVTLNDLCSQRNTAGPYLLKIDTQGAELDVLKGAERILQETELVILEVSFFEFFKGGPQFYDYIVCMKNWEFVPYDLFGLQYRLLDGAMSQVDIAFVREAGTLRTSHVYATKEQREAQTNYIRDLTTIVNRS